MSFTFPQHVPYLRASLSQRKIVEGKGQLVRAVCQTGGAPQAVQHFIGHRRWDAISKRKVRRQSLVQGWDPRSPTGAVFHPQAEPHGSFKRQRSVGTVPNDTAELRRCLASIASHAAKPHSFRG